MTTPEQTHDESSDLAKRKFLKAAALIAGGLGWSGLPGFMSTAAAAISARNYGSARFALELDGKLVDYLSATEGGDARGEVVQPPGSTDKYLSGFKYSEISLLLGATPPASLLDWINAFLAMKAAPKNGAIAYADFNFNEVSRLDFEQAVISEISLPAFNAAAKDAGRLGLKLMPLNTLRRAGSGARIPAPMTQTKTSWLVSSFRLQIQGLEAACLHVSKIEPISIRARIAANPVGEQRLPTGQVAGLELTNLVITLPENQAEAFYQWHEDFVIRGNNDQKKERPGFLELLAGDMKTVQFRIDFSGLGIISCAPEKKDAANEGLPKVRVEMYCEQIRLARSDPAAPAASPSNPPPLVPAKPSRGLQLPSLLGPKPPL